MRVSAVIADVVMGAILGVFLFAVAARTWSPMHHWAVAAAIILASTLIVLFRRPNGSLAKRR